MTHQGGNAFLTYTQQVAVNKIDSQQDLQKPDFQLSNYFKIVELSKEIIFQKYLQKYLENKESLQKMKGSRIALL